MMVSGRILSPHIVDASPKNMTPSEEWWMMYIPIGATCLFISILGIIGNGLLICLLSCRIKKTRFTIYVLNIAIANFILIFNYFIDNVIFFKPAQLMSLISPLRYITYLLGNDAGIHFLAVISAERYLMVFSPVWYHSHRPKHFTALMCIILWGLSLVMSLLEYFSCKPKYLDTNFKCDIVLSIHFFCNFMIFIPVVLFFTSALLTIFQRQSQRNFLTRLDISIMAAVVWTLVFWVPIKILDFLHIWVPHKYLPDHFAVSLVFESIYSSACPYIYLLIGWWKSQELQRSIPIFIERALKHTEENTSTATQEEQEQTQA